MHAAHPDRVPVWSAPLAVGPGEEVDIDLVLGDAVRLSGHVVGDDGTHPISASVRVFTENGRLVWSQGTDLNGAFDIRGLPADTSYRVEVSAEGYVDGTWESLAPGRHELVLARGTSIDVQVRLPDALARCIPGGLNSARQAPLSMSVGVTIEHLTHF